MLKIRMQRVGRINSPSFRVVVIEHARSPKAGNFLEKLGTYNPKTKERTLDAERIKYWISKGAQTSGTMHNMLISAGVIEGKKRNVLPKKSPASAKATVGEATQESVPSEVPAPADVSSEASAKEEAAPAEAPAPSSA